MIKEYTYYAFISYKREDEKWAKWLHKKLESYGFPTALRKKNPELPAKIRPVFRDKPELAGGNLKEEIEKGLENSKYLIVICSPRSAQSPWVSKEVQFFIDKGRSKYIIPFIIGGTPNSTNPKDECFPEGLRQLSGEKEILGININEMGRSAAAIKVISQMFGLRFDTLWQRHEKVKKKKRLILLCTILIFTFISFGISTYIYNTNVKLEETTLKQRLNLARVVAEKALALIDEGDTQLAQLLCIEIMSEDFIKHNIYVPEIEAAFRKAYSSTKKRINWATNGGFITAYDVDEDNNVALVGSSKGQLSLWNLNTGELTKEWNVHNGRVHHAEFSKDKKYIITYSFGNSVKIWDKNSCRCLAVLPFDTNASYIPGGKATLSPSSKYAACTNLKGEIILWDLREDNYQAINVNGANPYNISFSSNERFLLTINKNNEIVIIDVNSKSIYKRFKYSDTTELTNVIFASNNNEMISLDKSGFLKVWNLSDLKCIYSYKLPKGNPFLLKESDDVIFYVIQDKDINGYYVYKVYFTSKIGKEPYLLRTIHGIDGSINNFYVSKKGNNFSIIYDKSILIDILFTTKPGRYQEQYSKQFNIHSSKISSISLDYGGQYLVTSSEDNIIKTTDLVTYRQVGKTIKENCDSIIATALQAQHYNKMVISASAHAIKFWDLRRGVLSHSIRIDGTVTSMLLNKNRYLWISIINHSAHPYRSRIEIYDLNTSLKEQSPFIIENAFSDFVICKLTQSQDGNKILAKYLLQYSSILPVVYDANTKEYINSFIIDKCNDGVLSTNGNKIFMSDYTGIFQYAINNDTVAEKYFEIPEEMVYNLNVAGNNIILEFVGGFSILEPNSKIELDRFYVYHDLATYSPYISSILTTDNGSIKIIPIYPLHYIITKTKERLESRRLTPTERHQYYLEE